MFIIETERLKLIPLSLNNLKESIENKVEMEKSLGLKGNNEMLSSFMKKIYQIKINNILQDEENYLFHTYWLIVSKESNNIIGKIGYKNIPNEQREVEVGYGLEEEYYGKGYMTEALKGFAVWAFEQSKLYVSAVIATTNKDNIASQRVLKKNGMKVYNEDENFIWWRLTRYMNKEVKIKA